MVGQRGRMSDLGALKRPERDREILSFEQAKSNFEFHRTILDYVALLQSLSIEWKNRQRKVRKPKPTIPTSKHSEHYCQKHGNKYMYTCCSKHIDTINLRESGWEPELGKIDWAKVYKINRSLYQWHTKQYNIKFWRILFQQTDYFIEWKDQKRLNERGVQP